MNFVEGVALGEDIVCIDLGGGGSFPLDRRVKSWRAGTDSSGLAPNKLYIGPCWRVVHGPA